MTRGDGVTRATPRGVLVVTAGGLGTALALVVAEVVLRVLGLGYGNAPLEPSPELHHVHPTDYEFVVHDPRGEYGGFVVRYDEIGARVPPDGGTRPLAADRRIVFLGDSFTEANQVAWEDSFVGRLAAANPEVEVLNLGVSSYSPILFLIQARHVLDELDPTHLVVQIYANDFGDDRNYLRRADSPDVDRLTRVDGGERRPAVTVLRRSYVARLLRRVQLDVAHRLEQRGGTEAVVGSFLQPDLDAAPDTFRALELISELATDADVELLVMYVPNKLLAIESRCCDEDVTYWDFDERMGTLGIATADLAAAFSVHPDQQGLFFPMDIHFTPEGHRVVAAAVADALGLREPR
jgi:lysophospholipase L1-like esterase